MLGGYGFSRGVAGLMFFGLLAAAIAGFAIVRFGTAQGGGQGLPKPGDYAASAVAGGVDGSQLPHLRTIR
jgi:hypothetical protein